MALKRICCSIAIALTATFVVAPAAHAVLDEGDYDYEYDYDYPSYDEPADLLDEFVTTSPQVAPCPEGTAHLLYYGEPVVDADGNPVCVTPQAGGTAGETVPGENGEAGGAADSEGVIYPGQPGEIVNPYAV